jgi:hypothetical protein
MVMVTPMIKTCYPHRDLPQSGSGMIAQAIFLKKPGMPPQGASME